MTLRLHIERLVVDSGLGAAGADGQALREAIQTELARLLAEGGSGWAALDAWRVDGPGFVGSAIGGAEALGVQIAGALHGGLRKEQGERIP
jgi:hypothetical protein